MSEAYRQSDNSPRGSFLSDILGGINTKDDPIPPSGDVPPDGEQTCDIVPKELPKGHMLRGYRLLRTLGCGGFGITYLAEEEVLKRHVVIKENFADSICYRQAGTYDVMLHSEAHQETFSWALRNFLREARLLATIDHPSIAKVYSYMEAHNTAYYVTEFIDGLSLADVARSYAEHGMHIPQDAFFGTMARLLDALDYLHEKRLLHCDIKPDNILVNRQGVPILIDFGAAHEERVRMGEAMVESLGFTPSEQSAENGHLGPWTDLYAFGASLYYILTGECLPSGRQRELYDTVEPLAENTRLLAVYHPALLASIDKAIRPLPEQRYQSVSEWMDDLRL